MLVIDLFDVGTSVWRRPLRAQRESRPRARVRACTTRRELPGTRQDTGTGRRPSTPPPCHHQAAHPLLVSNQRCALRTAISASTATVSRS